MGSKSGRAGNRALIVASLSIASPMAIYSDSYRQTPTSRALTHQELGSRRDNMFVTAIWTASALKSSVCFFISSASLYRVFNSQVTVVKQQVTGCVRGRFAPRECRDCAKRRSKAQLTDHSGFTATGSDFCVSDRHFQTKKARSESGAATTP